jgi:hypothetical protein
MLYLFISYLFKDVRSSGYKASDDTMVREQYVGKENGRSLI